MEEVIVSAEEKAEEEALKHVPSKEDIRTEIIADFGFDEEADKERIDKAVERDFNQRVKTSKAIGAKITAREALAKAPKEKTVEVPSKDLSSKDIFALVQAKVPEEDVEEVTKTAKALGISIAEALKDPVTQTILERRASLRKTAEATSTTTARPVARKVTDESVLKEAFQEDKLPSKGSDEAERLFWAKRGGKK